MSWSVLARKSERADKYCRREGRRESRGKSKDQREIKQLTKTEPKTNGLSDNRIFHVSLKCLKTYDSKGYKRYHLPFVTDQTSVTVSKWAEKMDRK